MRLSCCCIAVVLAALTFASPASAQFVPGPNPITGTTGAQTLTAGTGTINAGGAISVSGGTTGLSMTGTSTLINNGTIQTSGSGRAIDSNAAGSNLTITNTGLITSNTNDAVRVNNAGSTVSLTNSGTISVAAAGGNAGVNLANVTGSNTVTNQLGGVISVTGVDAIRPGQNGVVNNAGTITATPIVTAGAASGNDGIDLRVQKTVTVTNTGTITGRHGIATDGANAGPSSLTVNNTGTIQAVNGSGLNVDGVSTTVTANVINLLGATIKGGVLAATTEGDGDGIDVDGVLTLNNSGDVLGLGAKGGTNNAEGIAAGGGSITNNLTGRIVGSTAAADAPNGDSTKAGNGILIDDSNGGNAVAKTSIINAGLIEGKSGFGIRTIGTFADTVTNSGTIIGGNGTAIDLGGGDDQVTVNGGTIDGDILGGDGFDTLTIGGDFSFGDSISSFGLVDILSGMVSFSGVSTYTGITRLNGGLLSFDDVDLLSSASSLDLSGGALSLMDTLVTFDTGQTFASLSLTGDSALHLGYALLNFGGFDAITAGSSLTIDHSRSNPLGYALRFTGDLSLDVDFLTLLDETTVNGFDAEYRVVNTANGAFTDILSTDPVPEPSTLALVGLGLSILAWRRRRTTTRR